MNINYVTWRWSCPISVLRMRILCRGSWTHLPPRGAFVKKKCVIFATRLGPFGLCSAAGIGSVLSRFRGLSSGSGGEQFWVTLGFSSQSSRVRRFLRSSALCVVSASTVLLNRDDVIHRPCQYKHSLAPLVYLPSWSDPDSCSFWRFITHAFSQSVINSNTP